MNSPTQTSTFSSYLIAIALLVALLLYQLSASSLAAQFLSFEKLEWNTKCSSTAVPQELSNQAMSITTFSRPSNEGSLICQSKPFALASRVLEVEYFLPAPNHEALTQNTWPSLILSTVSGEELAEINLREQGPNARIGPWIKQTLEAKQRTSQEQVLLSLSYQTTDNSPPWFSLRNRLNFYQASSPWSERLEHLRSPTYQFALCFVLALVLVLWGYQSINLSRPFTFAFFVLLITLAVHLRTQVYFYWDEWHVLGRYMDLGLSGIIYTHNEHFLPLFFGLYYLQSRVFGDNYLLYTLVSILLHSLNALLLLKLLRRFVGESTTALVSSRIVALLFVISALHAETLHWAFEQAVLCSQSITLLLLLTGWNFVLSGRLRDLLLTSTLLAVSPLFFGNGFASLLQLLIVVSGGLLFIDASSALTQAQTMLRTRIKRTAVLIVTGGISIAVPATLYLLHKEGAGHNIDQAKPFDNISAVADYLLVGTQLGTVLRGSGLFPAVELGAASALFAHFSEFVPDYLLKAAPEKLLAWLGLGASSLLLLVFLFFKQRLKYLRFWFVGHCLMLSALLLPALGRWQLGVQQSLSLRYQYSALIGFCLMVIPLFLITYGGKNEQEDKQRCADLGKKLCTAFLFVLLTTHLTTQLFLGMRFNYFTEKGIGHRVFIQQLSHWKNQLAGVSPSAPPSYEASGTILHGFQPLFPNTITPGRHPDDIYRTLQWLRD